MKQRSKEIIQKIKRTRLRAITLQGAIEKSQILEKLDSKINISHLRGNIKFIYYIPYFLEI